MNLDGTVFRAVPYSAPLLECSVTRDRAYTYIYLFYPLLLYAVAHRMRTMRVSLMIRAICLMTLRLQLVAGLACVTSIFCIRFLLVFLSSGF